jgi:hypothetical protein
MPGSLHRHVDRILSLTRDAPGFDASALEESIAVAIPSIPRRESFYEVCVVKLGTATHAAEPAKHDDAGLTPAMSRASLPRSARKMRARIAFIARLPLPGLRDAEREQRRVDTGRLTDGSKDLLYAAL